MGAIEHGALNKIEVLGQIEKICDWQLGHLPRSWPGPGGELIPIRANGWIRSTFYCGVMAAWEATGQTRYLEAARDWAERNQWQPGPRRHADDHCAGQVYLALYDEYDKQAMLAPLRAALEVLIRESRPGREEWWWCDALFMASSVLAGLYAATGDARYLKALDRL